jgi:hypothetical protein
MTKNPIFTTSRQVPLVRAAKPFEVPTRFPTAKAQQNDG